MTLENARRDAKIQADKAGHQLIVVEDPIGFAEDEAGPYGFFPTLSLPIFIISMRHGGRIIETVEPTKSHKSRRRDLEDGLITLFQKDPNLVKRR